MPASVVLNVVTQDGYYLPKELVEQLDNWKNANSHVKNLEYTTLDSAIQRKGGVPVATES